MLRVIARKCSRGHDFKKRAAEVSSLQFGRRKLRLRAEVPLCSLLAKAGEGGGKLAFSTRIRISARF
jgi:hypothetical protein